MIFYHYDILWLSFDVLWLHLLTCYDYYPPTPSRERESVSEKTLLLACCLVVLVAGRKLVFLLFGCVGGWTTPFSRVIVAEAPFLNLGGWKTATFLLGSEGDVRQWGPYGAVPFSRFFRGLAPGRQLRFLLRSGGDVRHWRPLRARPLRPVVWAWRRRRFWALAGAIFKGFQGFWRLEDS